MKFFAVISAFLFSSQVIAGHEVNNGGDIVYCPSTKDYYSLDYIIEGAKKADRDKVVRGGVPLERISKLISLKLPEMHESFKEYLSLLKNESDSSQPYIWKESPHELPEVNDERFGYMPLWCRFGSAGRPESYQTVVRKVITVSPGKTRIIFNYDASILRSVGRLQRSFIYVHEWLWNYTADVRINRKVNFFLHSVDFDNLTKEEVEERLKTIGFMAK